MIATFLGRIPKSLKIVAAVPTKQKSGVTLVGVTPLFYLVGTAATIFKDLGILSRKVAIILVLSGLCYDAAP
jgi:hypothetical protein